jgi:DNA repair protein RadC
MKSTDTAGSIKTWPKSERPREQLVDKGPEHVSDAGLVAVLLRTGTRGKDAVALARELLDRFGGLRGLMQAGPSELKKVKGLGTAKIAQLSAALEIAKRQMREGVLDQDYFRSADDVAGYLSFSMRDLREEAFSVIFLNRANAVIRIEELVRGTVDQTAIYPREVIRKALEAGASSVIFVHNHPSGSLEPSRFDRDVTRRLAAACDAVDITPLDHIIVSPQGTFSFQKHGLM